MEVVCLVILIEAGMEGVCLVIYSCYLGWYGGCVLSYSSCFRGWYGGCIGPRQLVYRGQIVRLELH